MLRFLKRSGITRQQAIEIARDFADSEGLLWQGKVIVHWGWSTYVVWTNAECAGGNLSVMIRRSHEKVLGFEITPR